jgi:hypothetical protein
LRLLSESILPIIFWVSLIFGFDTPYVAVLTIISAVAHELGHCAAIYLLSGEIGRVRGHSSGLRIKRGEALAYKREIMILLAGPSVNLALFLILSLFGNAMAGYIRIFAFINLATGLSNLMPFEGYDGYGAICEALRSVGKNGAVKHLETFSFVISIGISFIALYLIERYGEGYWIFGLFFFTVLSKLVNLGKYDIFGE